MKIRLFFLAFPIFFLTFFAFFSHSFADIDTAQCSKYGYEGANRGTCFKIVESTGITIFSSDTSYDRKECKDSTWTSPATCPTSYPKPANNICITSHYHAENSMCYLNTKSCSPAYSSKSGTQTWNIDRSTWGQCEGFTCNSAYYKQDGQCIEKKSVDLLALSTTTTLSPTDPNPITTGDPLDLNLNIGVNGCSGVAGNFSPSGIFSALATNTSATGINYNCTALNLRDKRIFFSVDWDSGKFSLNTEDANNYSNCRCDHVAQKHPINLNGAIV